MAGGGMLSARRRGMRRDETRRRGIVRRDGAFGDVVNPPVQAQSPSSSARGDGRMRFQVLDLLDDIGLRQLQQIVAGRGGARRLRVIQPGRDAGQRGDALPDSERPSSHRNRCARKRSRPEPRAPPTAYSMVAETPPMASGYGGTILPITRQMNSSPGFVCVSRHGSMRESAHVMKSACGRWPSASL